MVFLLLLVFFTILLMFSWFIYSAMSLYTENDFERILEIRALTTASAELDEADGAVARELRDALFGTLPGEEDYIVPITDSTSYLSFSKDLNIPASFFEDVLRQGSADYMEGHHYYKGILYHSEKGTHIVIASADNYFELHHSVFLRQTMGISIIAASIFFFVFSFYLSHFIFEPLDKMTKKVRDISSVSLHQRLDLHYKSPEMQALADTFNDMLNRIETAFETQNNFISNASHELRTPLTAIIGEADVALSKERPAVEYVETLKIILEEAETLERKTKALLFLAQTGFQGKVLQFTKVRIDQLLYDTKETLERINSKNKIHIDLSMLPENPLKLKVKGNEQLLLLAFSNIISNGCKYSDFKTVHVSIGSTETQVIVIISDSGIGIPDKDLPFIYDPFFRASNTGNYEGYGIGLPLTRNIVRVHGGKIEVFSRQDSGTSVQISLPIGHFTQE